MGGAARGRETSPRVGSCAAGSRADHHGMSPAPSKSQATPKGAAVPAGHPDLDGLTREIGIKDDGRDGPLVIVTAGLHGNEPGGVRALRALFAALEGTPTAGRIVGLTGNLAALRSAHGTRGRTSIACGPRTPCGRSGRARRRTTPRTSRSSVRSSAPSRRSATPRGRSREVILVDLHSTSADGAPLGRARLAP